MPVFVPKRDIRLPKSRGTIFGVPQKRLYYFGSSYLGKKSYIEIESPAHAVMAKFCGSNLVVAANSTAGNLVDRTLGCR